MPPLVKSDLALLLLAALALAAALVRRQLPRGMGVGLFVSVASVCVCWVGFRLQFAMPPDVLLIRITAALAVIWAACGWAARPSARLLEQAAVVDVATTSTYFFG